MEAPGPQGVPCHPGCLSPVDYKGRVFCWGHSRTTAPDLADAGVCRAGLGWVGLPVGVAGQRAGAQKGLRACPPYREVGGGGQPVKAIPERLEAVDVGGEVPRPGLGEDCPGCPQHPVGLEGLLQVLGQAAAVVDDGPQLLHLWAPGPCCGRGPLRGWADPPPHPGPGLLGRRMPPPGGQSGGEPSGSLLFLDIMFQGQYVFIAQKQ